MPLHEDRLFPPDQATRDLARELYATVRDLPLVCPHGHTEPSWFAEDTPFADPVSLLVTPDHYVLRMLYSQGVQLEDLGIQPVDGLQRKTDPEQVWGIFAANYHLFRATPTGMWLDHCFQEVFGIEERLSAQTADHFYATISHHLAQDGFRPRALYKRFNIEFLSTTDGALDTLEHHRQLAEDESWDGRVVPTYRPDSVTDPDHPGFIDNVAMLGELTGCETDTWDAYLQAHRVRRQYFRDHGALATDHGHPTARTANLSHLEAGKLYYSIVHGGHTPKEAEVFRAQMLTEMARMSLDDGMVMQLHTGSSRNHNSALHGRFGPDRGADIPMPTNYAEDLRPLLDVVGNELSLRIVLFTLDEAAYSRDLAPLAGHYPPLRLGAPWWFHDSFEGMLRYRRSVTETAGFHNTAGFNDDTRALLSLPARHDMARRADCAYLAGLVADHRLSMDDAAETASLLSCELARATYGI